MISTKWSRNLAYAVGLLVSDGCLSKDGRHLELTSADIEQLENFKKCLQIDVKITWKTGGLTRKKYPRIQFSDVKFYRWLLTIGLMPNKTKIIGKIAVPDKYFFDFLRGHFDGDGCTYSYWDPRWKSSFMIYLQFVSASKEHIEWLKNKIFEFTSLKGSINKGSGCFKLTYAKTAAKIIFVKLYHGNCVYLSRKRKKIEESLAEENKK